MDKVLQKFLVGETLYFEKDSFTDKLIKKRTKSTRVGDIQTNQVLLPIIHRFFHKDQNIWLLLVYKAVSVHRLQNHENVLHVISISKPRSPS